MGGCIGRWGEGEGGGVLRSGAAGDRPRTPRSVGRRAEVAACACAVRVSWHDPGAAGDDRRRTRPGVKQGASGQVASRPLEGNRESNKGIKNVETEETTCIWKDAGLGVCTTSRSPREGSGSESVGVLPSGREGLRVLTLWFRGWRRKERPWGREEGGSCLE